jgi:hypothetical protein
MTIEKEREDKVGGEGHLDRWMEGGGMGGSEVERGRARVRTRERDGDLEDPELPKKERLAWREAGSVEDSERGREGGRPGRTYQEGLPPRPAAIFDGRIMVKIGSAQDALSQIVVLQS